MSIIGFQVKPPNRPRRGLLAQKERILNYLRQQSMCSMTPLDWDPRITRVSARILDLRDEGYEIVTHPICYRHREAQHHAMYELVHVDGGTLF